VNPFQTVGYHGRKYFCDREEESKSLLSALKNNRPVNLVSIRRIGKSSLIKHVFGQLPKTYSPIFIDLEGTDSLTNFINHFTNNLARQFANQDKNFVQKLLKWASSFGASISLDPIDGAPKLELTQNYIPQLSSLDGLMRLMNQSKTTFVLAIDEFQEITKYEDRNVEGWIRSKMQEFPDIRFIFSGSEHTLMQSMFNDASRPFYQITQPMQLSYISKEKYMAFIKSHITQFDGLDEADIHLLINWCRGYTYYIQYFCNVLYSHLEAGTYTSLSQIKQEILDSHKHFFLSQKELITNLQWKLLKAVAHFEEVKTITSKEFVKQSGMATTSIQRSTESLLTKSLLLKENGMIKIYNVFFQRYLETLI